MELEMPKAITPEYAKAKRLLDIKTRVFARINKALVDGDKSISFTDPYYTTSVKDIEKDIEEEYGKYWKVSHEVSESNGNELVAVFPHKFTFEPKDQICNAEDSSVA